MKRQITLILSGLLMTVITISCGTGRVLNNGESDVEYPQCGFEETSLIDQNQTETKNVKASPAADRGNTLVKETSVQKENPSLAVTAEEEDVAVVNKNARKETKIGKKRAKFKQIVNTLKEQNKKRRGGGGLNTILLVIIAIFIPPLAVGLYEGITGRFWLTLVLWLIGLGLGFWLLGPGIGWVCGLLAVIFAILIVVGAW